MYREIFRIVAKLTQRIYGTSKYAAALEIFEKSKIDARIIAHKRTMTTAAPRIICAPKNTIDQSTFSRSWPAKTARAFLTSLLLGPFS
jgi:hypothetical protein